MARNARVASGAFALLFLAGCSVTGTIVPVASSRSEFDGAVFKGETIVRNPTSQGGVEYRVFNQGATGFVSLQANIEDAEARAEKFCTQRGESFLPLRQTNTTPPYILGNFPRVELIFECVQDVRKVATRDRDRYANLAALKKLLDSGALTKAEFEREKEKTLRQP